MKHLTPALLCVFLVPACGESSEPAPTSSGLEPLPTMEQARSEAAAEISSENADAEFERLKREIEADL